MKSFKPRIGKHDRADVATFHDTAPVLVDPRPLAFDQHRPNGRVGGDLRHGLGDFTAPNGGGGVDAIDDHLRAVDRDLDGDLTVGAIAATSFKSPSGIPRCSAANVIARYMAPVSRYSSPSRAGDRLTDGALAGAGRAVDRDHEAIGA